MQVVVLDEGYGYIDQFQGQFDKGIFRYQVNQFKIPLPILSSFKFFGQERTLAINYTDTIETGSGRLAYVIWDGKDYRQLTLKDISKPNTSVEDILKENRISRLTKESMLEKPFNITDWLPTINIFMGMVMLILFYFSMQHFAGVFQTSIRFLNQTTQQNQVLLKYLINQTHYTNYLDNQTIQILNRVK